MKYLCIPLIIIIRLIKPIIHIRFGKLITARIGHLSMNTAIYLAENHKTFDIFHRQSLICNKALYKEIKKKIRVWPIRWLREANNLLPGGEAHNIETTDNDWNHLIKTKPVGSLKLISYYSRNPRYIKSLEEKLGRKPSNKHDFRNNDIVDYFQTAMHFNKLGFKTKRLGRDSFTSKRDDREEIFYAMNSLFFVGASSGLAGFANSYGTPTAITDFIPISGLPIWNDALFIPKKIKRDGKYLNLRQMLTEGSFSHTDDYKGLEIINNNSDEILDLALEMYSRLTGVWGRDYDGDELQGKFREIFLKHTNKPECEFKMRIGDKFLKSNRYLLEE